MMLKSKLSISFVIAITLHVLLVLCLCSKFSMSVQNEYQLRVNSFPAYLHHPIKQHKKAEIPSLSGLSKKESLQHQSSKTAPDFSMSDQRIDDKLLLALHAAIAAQQHYPEAALDMPTTRRVKMKFVLFPDGHIENAAIAESSGSAELDSAALNAVTQARLDHGFTASLRTTKTFFIDIVFTHS